MKYLYSIIFVILFSSCDFRQSVNRDITTGAYSRGDGLSSDNVLIEVDKKVANRNVFFFGEEVNIIFNDVVGFKKIDTKVFPGVSVNILNSKKDTIQSSLDLLTDLEGTSLLPLQLKAKFTAIFPRKEQYEMHIKIWDKKGDGQYFYKLPFTIEDSKVLEVKTNGIKYTNIYLWNETQSKPVIDKSIVQDDTYILILEGLKGLKDIEGKVFPIFSIELLDSKGNALIAIPNLLQEVEDTGVGIKTLYQNQLTAKISFNKGEINNPCTFIAVIKDKNSNKKVEISTELEIKKYSFE